MYFLVLFGYETAAEVSLLDTTNTTESPHTETFILNFVWFRCFNTLDRFSLNTKLFFFEIGDYF